jgi:hypothetical protein
MTTVKSKLSQAIVETESKTRELEEWLTKQV